MVAAKRQRIYLKHFSTTTLLGLFQGRTILSSFFMDLMNCIVRLFAIVSRIE